MYVEVGQRLGKLEHDSVLCHIQRVGLFSNHGIFTVHDKSRLELEKSSLELENSRLELEKSRLELEKSRLD